MCRHAIASTPADALDAASVVQKLQSLAASGVKLCNRSARLVAAVDDSTAEAYIAAWRGRPVVTPPFVTAMVNLPLKDWSASGYGAGMNAKTPSTILVATEAQGVLLLSNTKFTVDNEWHMESVASMMCTHGVFLEQG
jgi:Ciliary BBSome complex subunit 1